MASIFEIGDIITGVPEGNGYAYTNSTAVMRVTEMRDADPPTEQRERMMFAEFMSSTSYRLGNDKGYWVDNDDAKFKYVEEPVRKETAPPPEIIDLPAPILFRGE